MIFRNFLTIAPASTGARLAAAALALAIAAHAPPAAPKGPGQARSASPEAAIVAAYEAYRAGDPVKLARHAAALEGHLLEPYAEFWRLRLRLEDAAPQDVRAFLAREAGSYLANRLRGDWLRELGARDRWEVFDLELSPLVGEDLEIRCHAWRSRLARQDDGVLDEAKDIWLEPRDLPESCAKLAEQQVQRGRVSVDEIWRRARLLFENGHNGGARRTLGWLPPGEAHDDRMFMQAATDPEKLLARAPASLARRPLRETMVLAIIRLARSDPRAAAEVLEGRVGAMLTEADRRWLWGRLGYEGARRHYAAALDWFAAAGDAELSDEKLAWKARAALRAGAWQTVRDAIDPMSLAARQDHAWTYWYARALAALGRPDGARAYFLRISGRPDFYGVLASEELGEALALPETAHLPTEDEVAQAARVPGLARALALYRAGLRGEAAREWSFAIRAFDDRRLIAASALALRHELYDRAINTAERTTALHNYMLRYLAPFREVFREHARAFELEEHWVLGLTRQESRFIVDAKSSAGARGLMQLMPATARWVARKIGLRDFHPGNVVEPEVNVNLGTSYLRLVLDDLGHPVLASAGYNAGPGRARRWRDAKPLEGAIYVETIPFNETRDYVKKVMANTVYYAALHDGRSVPLKARLGEVPAKSPTDRFNEKLP